MAIVLIVVIGITVSVPIVAAGLVAVASRREDSAWSLDGPAPGPVAAAARRVVAFRTQAIAWPRPQHRARVHRPQPADGHVRSPLPAQTHRPVATPR
jgi:hypothetical protein